MKLLSSEPKRREVEIAILFHNQMEHFTSLKDKGVNVEFNSEQVYKFVCDVYDLIIARACTHLHVMDRVDNTIGYLSKKVTPNVSALLEENIFLKVEKYSPSLENIPVDNIDSLSEEEKKIGFSIGNSDFLAGVVNAMDRFVQTKIKEAVKDKEPVIFDLSPASTPVDLKVLRERGISEGMIETIQEAIIEQRARKNSDFEVIKKANSFLAFLKKTKEKINDSFYWEPSALLVHGSFTTFLRLTSEFSQDTTQFPSLFLDTGNISKSCLLKMKEWDRGDIIALYNNPMNYMESSCIFSLHTPLYFDPESGTFSVRGCFKVTNPHYMVKIKAINHTDFF